MREHGEYRLARHGRIILAVVRDAWNEETFVSYANDVRSLGETIAESGGWAIVFDARDWELATPDALPLLRELSGWCVDHGLKAAVYLSDGNSLKESVARDYIFLECARSRTTIVNSPDEALAWLDAQDFTPPESIREQLIVSA